MTIKPAQMITRVLIGGCALIAVIGVLLVLGVGQSIGELEFTPRSLDGDSEILAELGQFRLSPLEEYAEIPDRPLFNDDRRPKENSQVEVVGGSGGPPPPVVLNVSVRGIIITSEVKVALVRDNATKQVHRLREGMPMEGDMGAWVLTSIEPRLLTFNGAGEEQAQVELVVNKKALRGGAPVPDVAASRPGARSVGPGGLTSQVAQNAAPGEDAPDSTGNQAQQSDEERAAKAEEIRRRVAERRAQLRAEAARRRAGENKEKE